MAKKLTPEKAEEILLFTNGKFSKEEYAAFNMALKALAQVPEVKLAVQLIKEFRDEYSPYSTNEVERNIYYAYDRCYMAIKHLAEEWDETDN